jgi:hypothetical protein
MPLSPKEAFKTGFLARCAEEGLGEEGVTGRIKVARDLCAATATPLTAEEEAGLLEKSADGDYGIGKIIGEGIEGIGTIAGKALDLVKASPWITIGGAGVLGAGGGYMAGKLRNEFDSDLAVVGDDTPEEILDIQAAEMVQALNREAAAAKRRAAMLRRKRRQEEEDTNRWSRI